MITRVLNLMASAFMFVPAVATTQTCADALSSISYDTVVFGSGNAYHNFSFSKFDPSLGTLMEVKLESEITLRYSFQLENREATPIGNYRVRVTRDDEISGEVLLNPVANSIVRTYGSYALSAWDGNAGSGSDYVSVGPLYVMNRARVARTVYNTADFLGGGSVSLDYASTTYSSVLGGVNHTYNGTAQDTIRLRLTYLYCATWYLKADLSVFTAVRNGETAIDLQWRTDNEQSERIYEIEKSYDGRNFEKVASRTARSAASGTSDYRYTYSVRQEDKKPKLIFRLKQKDKNGLVKYSSIRVLEIRRHEQPTIRIYPNPARQQAQLVFNNVRRGNWTVEVFTLSGNLVRRQYFNNALTGRLEGLNTLLPGIYTIKLHDRNSGDIKTEKLVIAR